MGIGVNACRLSGSVDQVSFLIRGNFFICRSANVREKKKEREKHRRMMHVHVKCVSSFKRENGK